MPSNEVGDFLNEVRGFLHEVSYPIPVITDVIMALLTLTWKKGARAVALACDAIVFFTLMLCAINCLDPGDFFSSSLTAAASSTDRTFPRV